jgi:DNA (cytosine-5)-methyltransferase 1
VRTFRIADLFCGAGGTSAGAAEAAEALGYKVELTAVNHWPVAIDTHTANHPGARHLCTGIDAINPRELFAEGELDLLWASPECTHHSIARGGKPINDQSRSTAWCVTRWAEALLPPHILIENVPEFATWGQLDAKGRPLKSKKGSIFQSWLNVFRSLGYRVDYRLFCAADYGDPTTRTRLFIECVRGRRKIVWPDATHSKAPDLLTQRRWTPAREIIDWELPAQSIFERKKPLSPKTMARIEAGLRKFGLKDFIVPQFGERPGQAPRTHDAEQPLPAVTSHGAGALVQPYIVAWDNQSAGPGGGVTPIDEPISTVVTKARHGVAEPFLVELRGTAPGQIPGTARSLDAPCGTITAGGIHHGLVEPFIISAGGTECPARPVSQPVGTVLTRDHRALVEPFLVKTANGESRAGEETRAKSLGDPLPTLMTSGDLALIEPHLLPQQQGGALRPVSQPTPTVSTAGAIALVEPFLVSFYGNGQAHDISEPSPTVTCKDRFGLVRPVVEIAGNRYLLDIRFRMLQPHELALAQGFPKGYKFTGTKTDQVKQIGNAVPRRLARALVGAVLSQNSDVSALVDAEEGKEVAA